MFKFNVALRPRKSISAIRNGRTCSINNIIIITTADTNNEED